jgi:hypothetical protein
VLGLAGSHKPGYNYTQKIGGNDTMDTLVKQAVSKYQEPLIQDLLKQYFEENEAARTYLNVTQEKGWKAIIDHITIRCHHVDQKAQEFLKLSYEYQGELIEYPDQGWWAKVYRKKDYPALFVDQAYEDERGKSSILPQWVDTFGDHVLHHIAVRVTDIEMAMEAMKGHKIQFAGQIVGKRGSRLRQIFTAAEVRQGKAYSVLELAERNNYDGFVPEQADSLMQASVEKRTG